MPSTSLTSLSEALAQLVETVAPSLATVTAGRASRSSFAVAPDLLVTAEEGLPDETEFTVTLPGGATHAASIAGRDAATDIALLRVPGATLAPVELAGQPLKTGALALAVGAREGNPVAALTSFAFTGPAWESLRGGRIDARLELAQPLIRAMEGGLVLRADGTAAGMAVSGPRRRSLVIPAATIARIVAALRQHGRIPRGYLGLGLQQVQLAGGTGTGAMIISLDPAGPGAAAGLHQGDIITGWNGAPVPSVQAMLRALTSETVGQVVDLTLRRGGLAIQLKLTIAERPAG
jgi:S1-C subfamily serine protease